MNTASKMDGQDYFLVPQDTVPAPSSLLFYPNSGQIIDTHDSIRYDVSFYTINQFPKLYFHQDSISFVMAHVDSNTATTDTLEKITIFKQKYRSTDS